MYHLNHLKMYSLVVLRTFILWCKHHHHSFSNPFSSCITETPYPLKSKFPFPFPRPLTTSTLLSVPMILTTLSIPCEQNHSICPSVSGLFPLA